VLGKTETVIAGCHGVSEAISAQFTLEMYVAVENRKKSLKPLFWGFKVVDQSIGRMELSVSN